MSLRLKMFLGSVLPFLMLLVVGVYSSTQMRTLSRRVSGMLEENERSVHYAVEMYEDLERMDSAVLLRLSGDEPAFRETYDTAVEDYGKNLKAARKNITLPGETPLLDSLSGLFADYTAGISRAGSGVNTEDYRLTLLPLFNGLSRNISELRQMNTEAMYATAKQVADDAARAALPGDLTTLAALLFALLFVWFSQAFVVKPLRDILKAVEHWRKGGDPGEIQVETGDELERLAEAVELLTSRRGGARPR